MTLMLDTDVIVDVLRRGRRARELLSAAGPDVTVSAVSVMELNYGTWRSARPSDNAAAVEQFLAFVTVAPFDEGAALHAGELRARLAGAGTPIGAYDVLIADHAVSLGAELATRNVKEFSRVPELTVLDWT